MPKSPQSLYLPRQLRDQIERLRHPGPDGKPTFQEFTLAILQQGIEGFEVWTQAIAWDDRFQIVPDPTLPDNEAVLLVNGKHATTVQLYTDEQTGEVVAEATDSSVKVRLRWDPTTDQAVVEACEGTPSAAQAPSSPSTTPSQVVETAAASADKS